MAEYVLHRLCESLDYDAPTYPTRQAAHAAKLPHQHVSFRCDANEQYEWRYRERNRFTTGVYAVCPWNDADWYDDIRPLHHTHLSVDHIGQIAYTPDEERGFYDRQIRTTPGKYLEQFALEYLLQANTEHFSAKDYGCWSCVYDNPTPDIKCARCTVELPRRSAMRIRDYIAAYTADHRMAKIEPTIEACARHKAQCTIAAWVDACKAFDGKFSIATAPADIERVYLKGPSSCMDGNHWDMLRNATGGIHPARVYGTPGTLAVAYIGDLSKKVTARCVVWPEKKIYTRVYGDSTLTRMLQNAGWSNGNLNGARIARIECDYGLVMPYIDAADWAYQDGRTDRYLILTNDYDRNKARTHKYHGTKSQSGTTEEPDQEEDTSSCGRCGDTCDDDETYCQSCLDDSYVCNYCEDMRWADDHGCNEIGDYCYCDRCVRNNARTCAQCDDRHFGRNAHFCPDCEDDYKWCDDCDTYFDAEHVRCESCTPATAEENV